MKKIDFQDLKLTEEEMKKLIEGARKYVALPEDDEPLTPEPEEDTI
jgi:hypothetical protein